MVDLLLQLLYKLMGHAKPKHTIINTSKIDIFAPYNFVSHNPANGSTGEIPLNSLRPISFSTMAYTVVALQVYALI